MVKYTNPLEKTDNIDKPKWMLHMDGSSNQEGSSVKLVFQRPFNVKLYFTLKFIFDSCNNEVKYEGLITSLNFLQSRSRQCENRFWSSISGLAGKDEYESKGDAIVKYPEVTHNLVLDFPSWSIHKILKVKNRETDRLSRFAAINIPMLDTRES